MVNSANANIIKQNIVHEAQMSKKIKILTISDMPYPHPELARKPNT